MAGDRTIGAAILIASILGILVYGWLVMFEWEITLKVTAFLGITLILGILAWIGYTMATTPPPEPIADIPDPTPKPATEETQK